MKSEWANVYSLPHLAIGASDIQTRSMLHANTGM